MSFHKKAHAAYSLKIKILPNSQEDWFGFVEANGQLSNHLEDDLQRFLIFEEHLKSLI
jgi:hypothetical protein